MKKEILVIGGTGMVGKRVVNELIKEDIKVYSLQRTQSLSKSVSDILECIQGDVRNYDQIKKIINSLPNLTHIYFHPPVSLDTMGNMNVDVPGTKNLLKAIEGRNIHFIKLSEIGAWNDPNFYDISQKYISENETKSKASKWTILRPTWFMESIPNLLTISKFSIAFGNKNSSIHWLAGEDYAKTVVAVLKQSDISTNKIFTVQGPEAIGLSAALKQFNEESKSGNITLGLPVNILKIGYYLSSVGRFNYEIMNFYDKRREIFESEETWKVLHKPTISLKDFAAKEIRTRRGAAKN